MGRTKVWITGAKGKLGSTIAKQIDYLEYVVLTSDQDVDITNQEDVISYVEVSRPDVVINCAGLSDEELCMKNPAEAYKVNALGVRNLAAATRKIGAKLIQISTDDVFSGDITGGLTEFDLTGPITVYGKSKLAGENFVRELNPRHLIVRSSWVYGGSKTDFVEYILGKAAKEKTIYVPNDQISSPTSAKALADFILKILHTKEYGVYHAACEGSCTRYEFARTILEYAGIDSITVEPSFTDKNIIKPKCTLLHNLMMEITGIYKMPYWKDALSEYLKERN
ncbi:MAG: dTDP-4-dehydrorhamnose reductase [Lachnospiraceae bacterium]|nr:dTDP-4-dehydrorhamnose reductase [Lachnospiraceae bacterium]